MLARDILKGTNEFGLHNAIAYMISDGGPAMNFGHVDCSDAAEDRFKRLSRWTTEVLGTVPDHWTGIDGEPSDHCHYSYRYVQLYGICTDVLLQGHLRRRPEQRRLVPRARSSPAGSPELVLRQREAVLRDAQHRARRAEGPDAQQQVAQRTS